MAWDGDLPPGTYAWITLAGEEVDGNFEHGFPSLALPLEARPLHLQAHGGGQVDQ